MLESFAINICVDTAGNDYYDQVAINKDPIIVLGRDWDVKNLLSSSDTIKYLKSHIRSKEIYDNATYHVVHMTRDNRTEKFVWKVPDITIIDWDS